MQLPRVLHKTGLNRAVSLCILQGTTPFLPLFCAVLLEKRGYPTPENAILHPILHPKLPVNTEYSGYGCRKCMIFFQNFFRGERRDSGPGVVKHRTSLGKSTDVFECSWNTPCFPVRVRFLPPTKKVFGKNPTFPTPFHKTSFMYMLFRV